MDRMPSADALGLTARPSTVPEHPANATAVRSATGKMRFTA
ncbi:hypothetical protein MA3A0930S_2719 [Mycobacteroides abscessus 3A-0930-S]|nr:hypothetical protein MA3A0930S_2719 [Mycobacteroides abscessus 3A-0930-S]